MADSPDTAKVSPPATPPRLAIALAWAGVWTLQVYLLLTFPPTQAASTCREGLRRAAVHCGWVAAAARLTRGGPPVGACILALTVAASLAYPSCAPALARARVQHSTPWIYPAGAALTSAGALLAAADALRRRVQTGGSDVSGAASWHPGVVPATPI